MNPFDDLVASQAAALDELAALLDLAKGVDAALAHLHHAGETDSVAAFLSLDVGVAAILDRRRPGPQHQAAPSDPSHPDVPEEPSPAPQGEDVVEVQPLNTDVNVQVVPDPPPRDFGTLDDTSSIVHICRGLHDVAVDLQEAGTLLWSRPTRPRDIRVISEIRKDIDRIAKTAVSLASLLEGRDILGIEAMAGYQRIADGVGDVLWRLAVYDGRPSAAEGRIKAVIEKVSDLERPLRTLFDDGRDRSSVR